MGGKKQVSRIGIIGRNSASFVSTLISIWNQNDCAVIIDPEVPLNIILKNLYDSKVTKCFIDDELYQKLEQKNGNIKFERMRKDSNSYPIVISENVTNAFVSSYSSQEAVILFSSGTTGESKGIILSFRAINRNADMIIDYMRPTRKDAIYIIKTLSHSSTIIGELLVGLKSKSKIVLSDNCLLPRKILQNIETYQISIMCMNPTLLYMLTSELERRKYGTFEHLKIYTSGSVLDTTLLARATQIWKCRNIFNVYGLTEAGPRVCAQTEESNYPGSVGKPIGDVRIKFKNLQWVNQKNVGEICIKTSTICLGTTKGSLTLEDGWYSTGDLGYQNEFGEIFVVGRCDELIIQGGHNIMPSNIEQLVMQIDEVQECVVTEVKDEVYGQIVVCLYVSESVLENQIYHYLKDYLAPYEMPKRYLKVKEIPKNINGKRDRKKIKELLIEKENGDGVA